MAYGTKSASELVAYIMAHFPVQLSAYVGPAKNGKRQGYAKIVGAAVPNDRALALCALAGQHSNCAQPQASDDRARPAKYEIRALTDMIGEVLRGLVQLTNGLIDDIARGLDADAEQTNHLRSYAVPATMEPISPEAVADYYRAFTEQQRYRSTTSRTSAKHELFDSFRRKLGRLLPARYPSTFSIVDMAAGMDVTAIEDVAQLSSGTGLYGPARHWGPSITAFSMLSAEPRVVLLGNPGSGKSTILAGFCIHEITRHHSAAFFVRIPEISRAATRNRPQSASDAAQLIVDQWLESFDLRAEPALRDQLRSDILDVTDVVVAFDGLDEITASDERASFARLVHLLDEVSAKIVISSRITGYAPIMRDCHTAYVEPFPEEGPSTFAHKWFDARGPEGADGLARALRAMEHPQMTDSCRTPVIASLVCIVAEVEEVRACISGLYRQYVDLHVRRAWRHGPDQRLSAAEIATVSKNAQDVAWAMATAPTITGGIEWRDTVDLAWLIDVAGLPPRVLDLYQSDGLLVGHGIAPAYDVLGQQVRWLHRTLHEHLVGWRLAAEIRRDFAMGYRFLRARLISPQWEVPILHMSELLGDEPILRALLDNLINEFRAADTPCRSLLNGAAMIASSAVTRHRFAQIFGPSADTLPWRVEPLIDAGLVSIEEYCEMLGDGIGETIEAVSPMARLISERYPDGPSKIELLKPRTHAGRGNTRLWLEAVKAVNIDEAYSLAVEVAHTRPWACDEMFWRDMPTTSSKPLLEALSRAVADGSRVALVLLAAVAHTGNEEIIAQAHSMMAVQAPRIDFFEHLLDEYCRGADQREWLNGVSDEQLGRVCSTAWGSQIEHGIGSLVSLTGRALPENSTSWTQAGWTSQQHEYGPLVDARPEGLNVEAVLRRFAHLPLPEDARDYVHLYQALSWIGTGRSTLAEAEAFLELFYSEGLQLLDTFGATTPTLDSTYIHLKFSSIGPDRMATIARRVLSDHQDVHGRFTGDNAVDMLAKAMGLLLYPSPQRRLDGGFELTVRGAFEEVMVALRAVSEFSNADIDLRFDEAVPENIDLAFIEDATAKLALIPNEKNRRRIAQVLELLTIAIGYEHRVLDVLLMPAD